MFLRKVLNRVVLFLLNNVGVFSPDGIFRLVWDFIILLFLCLNAFYIPTNIAFSEEFKTSSDTALN